MSRWNQGLNPEQIQAVAHDHGPLLILAGAGSGKTTVLVARTGRMIEQKVVAAENALVLTFTNKAARELKHRVAAKLGGLAQGLWAGTFHSFGLQLLRRFHEEAGLPAYFGILDQNDCQGLVKELMRDVKVTGKDKFDVDTLLEIIQARRVNGREKEEAWDEYHELAEVLYPKFIKRMDLMGAVDFEGLLLKPLELLRQHPHAQAFVREQFRHIMVDEFQDTNSTQMKLIEKLVGPEQNIAVVGDDDQSIYGWRGAEVRNILDFPKLFKPCNVIRLERNYRSTSSILGVANEVIAKNKHRHGKILKPESKEGSGELPEVFVFDNEEEEAEFVAREIQQARQNGVSPADIAVLYRSNSQGGMMESYLRQQQIPYTVSGSTAFFDRKEIKDVLAFLRFGLQPNDVSLRRMINTPPRGIGDTSIEKLTAYSMSHKKSFVAACREAKTVGIPDKAEESLRNWMATLQALPQRLLSNGPAAATLLTFLREIGFRDFLAHSSGSSEAGEKKWALVEIFSRVLESFVQQGGAKIESLREFVDAMELRDDGSDEKKKESVSLMTLHASKGLEFPCVYLIGVEEDLLPHKNLGQNVDEERRLFYVGLTRAQRKLILSRCRTRRRYGDQKPVTGSRFLLEIPKEMLRIYETGLRPVSGEQREKLFSDFMSKLDSKKRPPNP